ncbi:MAG: hypothetical protein IT471_01100 [Pseudomonadales bacterium]|nr:hypothetical protein [Pseudomonadales bacterium]
MTEVVDTNVLLIANGQHGDVSPACVRHCAERLLRITQTGRIAIDDGFRILREYGNKANSNRGRGPGDAFLKWVLQNHAVTARCDRVAITETAPDQFEEFPVDPELVAFDPPDRKFVAVARAHGEQPPILQGADSKWLGWADALARHGVTVDFLCPDDVQRFRKRKGGS